MSKKARLIIISAGCCCIIAAAALTLYNQWTSKKAADEADKLSASFFELLEAATPEPDDGEPGTDEFLTENAPNEAETDGEEEPASVSVGGYNVCGSISIPKIGVELAVISDWSYTNLNISACRYRGAPDGQLMVMAHNYNKHFGRLNGLSQGDTVTFTGVGGAVYTYEVTVIETLAGNQLRELISGEEWDMTLFTCTYGGENRVVARLRLV